MAGLVKTLELFVVTPDGSRSPLKAEVEEVLLAGYTGRDRAKVMEHIHELEKLGVAPPPSVPMVYVVDADLLTTGSTIETREQETSGEVEVYLLPSDGSLLVGLGSDHTDRRQEAIDVAASKGLCPKVLSAGVWRYEDIKAHWDQIEIRSWAVDGGGRRLYQDGTLAEFLRVDDLLAELRSAGHDRLERRLIFGGTIPTRHGFVYASRFEAELRDPVLGRSLNCGYDVNLRTDAQGDAAPNPGYASADTSARGDS